MMARLRCTAPLEATWNAWRALCSSVVLPCNPVARDSRPLFSTSPTPGGRTPLHMAAVAGHAGVAATLLAHGASPELSDWHGATAWDLAQSSGHEAVFRTAATAAAAAVAAEGRWQFLASRSARRPPPECALWQPPLAKAEAEAAGEAEGTPDPLNPAQRVRARTKQRLSLAARPLLHAPFVLARLFEADAALLLDAALAAAARRGWQTDRHPFHATVDLPAADIAPAAYAALRARLDGAALPALRARYRTAPLRVQEAFFVKYEAPAEAAGAVGAAGAARQNELGLHRDGTLLNCVVLLNEPRSFEGGGTLFAPPLDRTMHIERGDCLCSSGQLRHGAAPVTRGVRYVLVAFIEEEWTPPPE